MKLSDQEILNYWYKYVHNNYPFINWRIEVKPSEVLDHVCLVIIAKSGTTGEAITRDTYYYISTDQRMINYRIKHQIRDIVAKLREAVKKTLKQRRV